MEPPCAGMRAGDARDRLSPFRPSPRELRRWSGGVETGEQAFDARRNFGVGALEDCLVGARRLAVSAHFPHELKRGGGNVLARRGRVQGP